MQDRFKLRAINVKTKEIIYIEDLYWFEEEGIHNIDDDGIARGISGEYYINQCIGLPDKNDKLIYDGDICEYYFDKIGKQRAIICFNNNYAAFIVKPLADFQYTKLNNCEIIGNVYQNRELLEQ